MCPVGQEDGAGAINPNLYAGGEGGKDEVGDVEEVWRKAGRFWARGSIDSAGNKEMSNRRVEDGVIHE